MKKAEDDNLIRFYCEINRIRELSQQTAPELSMDFGIHVRIPRNIARVSIKDSKELFPKSRRLGLIPEISADNIFLDFGNKTYHKVHFLLSTLFCSSSRDRRSEGVDSHLFSLLSNSSL